MKKTFAIDGMHCTSCALTIDFDLEDLSGVKSAKTSYAQQECTVEFDEEEVASQDIVQTIEKLGYKVKDSQRAQ